MKPRSVGLFTLVALVIGNMLGAGVFTTSGFALGDLGSPMIVLLAWFLGGLVALCGALSYGALARLMPVSGGEYFFLSRVVHPLAGFIAGWVSLWAGFTAAIAFAAITLEAYLLPAQLSSVLPANVPATLAILVAALAHGLQVRYGAVLQNLAVILKLVLISSFILFALLATDNTQWQGVTEWQRKEASPLSLPTFATTLMWISFSYSGFNAAVYIASEAPDARRLVPRAILVGTLITMLVYLLLNAIFVFAPAPEVIANKEDVAALAAQALGGKFLEGAMRGIIAIALFTSVSAMIMVGPRVYARMAEDGLMPKWMEFRGQVPARAIAAQALLAIVVVWLADLRELLSTWDLPWDCARQRLSVAFSCWPGATRVPPGGCPATPGLLPCSSPALCCSLRWPRPSIPQRWWQRCSPLSPQSLFTDFMGLDIYAFGAPASLSR